MNLKGAVGTTKHTKDTKRERLGTMRPLTQREDLANGSSASAFVRFVYFVV